MDAENLNILLSLLSATSLHVLVRWYLYHGLDDAPAERWLA
ncbi:MAG: hypothetical protein GAK43_01506 [Stenotrophomonas maltophilia]|nr:MAG: hypothetical protein GAK43_01506 [Stenotrophomonas maltophilia]